MSQTPRPKHPLDVLQSMVNGILIETGKALRSTGKEGGRSLANANTRLKSTIPSAVENFHLALDELEYDIVRAKCVLLRDLEELRSQRIALERPVESEPVEEFAETVSGLSDAQSIKEEDDHSVFARDEDNTLPEALEQNAADTSKNETQPKQDIPQDYPSKAPETAVGNQEPTLASSAADASSDSKPVGLGINTDGAEMGISPPETGDVADSAVDSLFDIPGNDNGESDLNFEDLGFSLPETSGDNQNPDQVQITEDTVLDLSTFGNSPDFDMVDLQTSGEGNITDIANNEIKPAEDLLDISNIGGGDSMGMDLDMEGMGEESVFDDMFFGGADDGNVNGEGEMEHGEFDKAFFGLE